MGKWKMRIKKGFCGYENEICGSNNGKCGLKNDFKPVFGLGTDFCQVIVV